jgi:hypothetical protein
MMRACTTAILCAGLVWSAAAVLPGSAQAQNDARPIGKVVSAAGEVTVEHVTAVVLQANLGAGPAPTKVGDPVYQGDVVQTGADGKLAITFSDGTAFNLSSNARMVLNEFVYDPNSRSNSSLISLTKGTFTFVAGKVAKTGDMKVDTPVATMGIRGTTPHVEIADDGTVAFSTLVEEGKNRPAGRRAALGRPRPVDTIPPASAATELKKVPNTGLNICKGC